MKSDGGSISWFHLISSFSSGLLIHRSRGWFASLALFHRGKASQCTSGGGWVLLLLFRYGRRLCSLLPHFPTFLAVRLYICVCEVVGLSAHRPSRSQVLVRTLYDITPSKCTPPNQAFSNRFFPSRALTKKTSMFRVEKQNHTSTIDVSRMHVFTMKWIWHFFSCRLFVKPSV